MASGSRAAHVHVRLVGMQCLDVRLRCLAAAALPRSLHTLQPASGATSPRATSARTRSSSTGCWGTRRCESAPQGECVHIVVVWAVGAGCMCVLHAYSIGDWSGVSGRQCAARRCSELWGMRHAQTAPGRQGVELAFGGVGRRGVCAVKAQNRRRDRFTSSYDVAWIE
eukprot:XP_001689514.1 predicted protein [Chlamydomonas reinhardtii]